MNILLHLLTFTSILSALLVITSRSPIISILFLIAVFINVSGYLILLGINFIALAYIMIYIGAIAILFLFVIMMLNIRLVELTQVGSEYSKNIPLTVIVASTFSYLISSIATTPLNDNVYLITTLFDKLNYWFSGINSSGNYVNVAFNFNYSSIFVNFEQIQSIGSIIYSSYALYLILVSFILLLAMLGPIIITLETQREKLTPPGKLNKISGFSNRYYSTQSKGSNSLKASTKRLTNVQRNSFFISSELHDILIGLTLGDLGIYKYLRGVNAYLRFEQGLVNEAYALHLFDLFKDLTPSAPKYSQRKPDFRTGKIYSRIQFYSYSLPCFNYYHELFYVDKVKRIPDNIGELLTPVGLAYWSMDDGAKLGSGFVFNTHSYTFEEVQLLIKILKENFDLNCTTRKQYDKFTIYIRAESMKKFRALVTPHFHSSMLYKLLA